MIDRPLVPVLRGYAATKPGATTALDALLLPPDQPLAIADFGRTQFAAVLAATTAFAASATGMASQPRCNFQFILNDACSSFEVKDGDVPTFRLGLAHAAFAVANRSSVIGSIAKRSSGSPPPHVFVVDLCTHRHTGVTGRHGFASA